ncbi:hypothetical protein UFOVP594_41 [uncultured Caudovirales phage]|uniref:Uncharacterized protein n=1 Tax=uncultured Caudovirales phage TaxID=2100421 RepID=A0A6J5N3P5_9CAUD|nr:hypothetical protein UFOVP594_41 [uncultured Caudovirales phage]
MTYIGIDTLKSNDKKQRVVKTIKEARDWFIEQRRPAVVISQNDVAKVCQTYGEAVEHIESINI